MARSSSLPARRRQLDGNFVLHHSMFVTVTNTNLVSAQNGCLSSFCNYFISTSNPDTDDMIILDLTGLFNLLTRPNNQHILERLTLEIRNAFQADVDINFQGLAALPYLTAVIEEGLRMFPSAPIGFTRAVPAGGDTVAGEYLPGGTTVSVCMWAATKSQRNFADPYVFRPERWLDRDNATDKLGASNPFSLGPRGCIGKHLSYMEMRLIIGKLLWHNDVSMLQCEENEVWNPQGEYKKMRVYTNWIKPGLKLRLVPREAR